MSNGGTPQRNRIAVEGQSPDGVYMTSGEVERLTGVTQRTLRHYETVGLLCPRRTGLNVANDRKLYD